APLPWLARYRSLASAALVGSFPHDNRDAFVDRRFASNVSPASNRPPATNKYHHNRWACARASSVGPASPTPAGRPPVRPETAARSSRGSSGVRSDSVRSTLLASTVAESAPAPCVRTS